MWDFSKLLGSLAGEDAAGFLGGVTDPSAKKRMPPKTELTPSESAGQEMVAGMHEAATPPTTAPVSGFRQGLAGGLKSAGAAMGQMASSPDVPMRPTQIYDQPIITPYQATQVPRFAQGGVVPDGWSQVGDGGNDPNAEEWIHKKGDKVVVIPKNPPTNPDNVMSQPITLPQQNGDYTIQQGRPGTQPVAVSPQTPMGTADDIVNPNLATQGNHPVQQEQQHVDPLQKLYQQKQDLNAQPIQKQSFWKDFGTNLLLGANAFFNPQQGPTPLVGWGAVKRQNENTALDRQIKPLEAIKTEQDKEAYNKARIDNIYADNELNKQRVTNEALYRKNILDDKATARKAAALNKINTSHIFDPTNAAHRALAKEAGLDPDTMTKWDFTAPHVAKIGDEKYLYDRTTGAFKPSGLPPDPNDKRQEFDVQIPGEDTPRKFMLTDKEASGLAVRMQSTGLTIQAANERNAANNTARAANMATSDANKASIANVKSEEQFAKLASTIRMKYGTRRKDEAEAAVAKAREDWNAARK